MKIIFNISLSPCRSVPIIPPLNKFSWESPTIWDFGLILHHSHLAVWYFKKWLDHRNRERVLNSHLHPHFFLFLLWDDPPIPDTAQSCPRGTDNSRYRTTSAVGRRRRGWRHPRRSCTRPPVSTGAGWRTVHAGTTWIWSGRMLSK